MSSNQCLVEANIRTLQEGIDLLSTIHNGHYSTMVTPAFESTIGAHFRHIFEHYRCFLSQLDQGVVCYDQRERDQILERDIGYARRTADELIAKLAALDVDLCNAPLRLRDAQVDRLVDTSVARELIFLQSHTVHHFALIGAISRLLGESPEEQFGVAEATRVHRKTTAQKTAVPGKSSCAQ